MSAPRPAFAAVVVRDLDGAAAWYARALGASVSDDGRGWVCLDLPNGSTVELYAGDPDRPGQVFPSYAGRPGPRVLPGYAVEDPELLAHGLPVTRSLPGWVVVEGPSGLRVVLLKRDVGPGEGLTGFRFTVPDGGASADFLRRLGIDAGTTGQGPAGTPTTVVPVFASDRDADVVDPDGTPLRLEAAPTV